MTVLQTVDNRLLAAGVPPFNGRDNSSYVVTSSGQGSVSLSGNLTSTYEMIFETNPNCAAVVNKLVRQISTLPIKVYDRPAGEGAPEEVRSHPVAKLLNSPAPRRGQSYWKQGLARSALIHGNGLLAKYRGPSMKGAPQAILPVSWPHVAAYAPIGAPVEWWGTFQTGVQRFFSVEDSVHLAWESQDLHGLGVSPLKQLAMTIKSDDASRRYQSAAFSNAARPAGALTPPADFVYKENDRQMLREELSRVHEGVDNAFKTALLAPGFTWTPFAHTAVESEVIAARQLNREEFAMVYDVPPPMIGDLTHATYSNVEELHRILYITTLRPWFAFIEEILQAHLINNEPDWNSEEVFVQFDLAEVLRGNRREEIDAAAQGFVNGLMTLNEVREFLELSPVDPEKDPDGLADMPHIPKNNLQPLVEPAEATSAVNPNEIQAPGGRVVPPAPTRQMHDDITNV